MDFSKILNRIEENLNLALPETSTPIWQSSSFGKLSECVTNKHITNLITPNKTLISLGGKRWRPVMMILFYEMAKKLQLSSSSPSLSEEQIYSLSPLVEFVHTASLIHDDIEDSADLRRGKPAAHITYGLDTALNSASWLYFEAPVCINTLDVSAEMKLALYEIYTTELRRLHLGQAMDIYWHRNPEIFPSKEEYFSMVKCKTGTLASLATKIGCVAGGLSLEKANEYAEIAANIGIGFQIIDDVINLTTGNVGKKRGDDIVEGKKSLPVLIHIQKSQNDKDKISEYMRIAATEGIDSPVIEECISLLEKSGAIQQAASEGTKLISDNCNKLDSKDIQELFTNMIPESFR